MRTRRIRRNMRRKKRKRRIMRGRSMWREKYEGKRKMRKKAQDKKMESSETKMTISFTVHEIWTRLKFFFKKVRL